MRVAIRKLLVIALLVAGCGRQERQMQLEREAALKEMLATMRTAIANFHADKKRYPSSLDELVPSYLRKIPADPITESLEWNVITEETVAVSSDFTTAEAPKPVVSVLDVRSKAQGVGLDGKPYSEY